MLYDADEKALLIEHDINFRVKNKDETANLILTNKRIVVETTREKKRMLFVKDKEDIILLNVPLASVLIAEKRKDIIFKGHEFKVNANGVEHKFKVKDPQLWINQIATAKANPGGVSQSQNVVVQPQSPQQIVQNTNSGGTTNKEVIKVRCKSCGQLTDETNKFCPACGAAL